MKRRKWLVEKEKGDEQMKGRKRGKGRRIAAVRREERLRGSRMDRGRRWGEEMRRRDQHRGQLPVHTRTNVLMGWNHRLVTERETQKQLRPAAKQGGRSN